MGKIGRSKNVSNRIYQEGDKTKKLNFAEQKEMKLLPFYVKKHNKKVYIKIAILQFL
ncbi:hypothetical protein GGR06_003625 [Bacteroides reticulotermitis]|uniref:Uncharacterized protein n=2 Tax=Bacteroides reticulotermitis TaxID=1133319 RepID=W4UWI9_9BACE|nr:hypothetical protein [Bacteroides reticulotermitis]GAE84948.1 hypothetical protein JCM10512_3331 [Bacteroides reticulotermitis JCM 10512]